MEFSFLKLIFSFLSGIQNPELQKALDAISLLWEDVPKYVCKKATWKKPPSFIGSSSIAEGVIISQCDFEATGKGGYPMLDAYLHRKIKTEAQKVFSGPTDEVFRTLPSARYDVSIYEQKDGDHLTIRQDVHIATDQKTKLVFASFSKKIDATGNAEYLKKVNLDSEIIPSTQDGYYAVRVEGTFQLDKPWYAPGGMFLSKVKEKIESQVPKTEKKLIVEIAKNI